MHYREILKEFDFKRIDVIARSAVSAGLSPDCRKGIYFYIFSDGSAYIGKSVDMVRRHTDHVHEYKHRADYEGITISKAYFMPVEQDTTEDELDFLETQVIQAAEIEGYSLRNLQKTNLPGGCTDSILTFSDQEMMLLPWRREERTNKLPVKNLKKPTESQSKRFDKLMRIKNSKELLNTVSKYVLETMTEPAYTIGVYWSATAFPSRNNGSAPCLRITCGTLETLSIWHDEGYFCGFLNIKRPENNNSIIPAFPFEITSHGYSATDCVVSIHFGSLDHLGEILSRPAIPDWAYRLNIEMFRHGKNPQAKFSNPLLAGVILGLLHHAED